MKHYQVYHSIIGDIIIVSNGQKVCEMIFKNQPNFYESISEDYVNETDEIIEKMKKWLGLHFIGIEPDFEVPCEFDLKI